MLKVLLIAAALLLAVHPEARAMDTHSWNLSRAMMNGMARNPDGPWSYMQNLSGGDDPVGYTLLPTYSTTCLERGPLKCWINADIVQPPILGVAKKRYTSRNVELFEGVPLLHPGQNSPVVLRWRSPVTGKLTVMGRVAAIDPNCCIGDGINWMLKNTLGENLASGHLDQSHSAKFLLQDLPIARGESLYFVVEMGGTIWNDSTNLDLLITSQP